ncbi:MAG: peptidase M50 [Gallionellaceae bacterium]|nr:MAG: peptidase M50 [Gallionellaceae bacterium]
MQLDHLIQTIAISAIPILFAITLHEAAHGYAARYYGDMTAYQQGRISLNPIRHIDPVGTILLPMLTLWLGGILFGWAKPVPVNFSALRNPKKDMLWVALAGPAANLFMVVCWVFILKMAVAFPESYFYKPLAEMAKVGVQINVVLMALNLLPLPPLDGGRIAVSLLPHRQAYQLSRVEPYGLFILIFLAMTPVLGWLLRPMINLVYGVIRLLIGM